MHPELRVSNHGLRSHGSETECPAPQRSVASPQELDHPLSALSLPHSPSQRDGCGAERQRRNPTKEILAEVIQKLFTLNGSSSGRQIYCRELAAVAEKLNIASDDLIGRAVEELDRCRTVQVNSDGKVMNPEKIGKHFSAVMGIVNESVDLFIVDSSSQLTSDAIPLAQSHRSEVVKILSAGEAMALIIVRVPPQEVCEELRAITESKLHGMWSLWKDAKEVLSNGLGEKMQNYLRYATVRVLCTGDNADVSRAALEINRRLERDGEFESAHRLRVVQGIAHHERAESLKEALMVCGPVVVGIKALEHVFPAGLHAVGGMLDDLFGAILPDVSQNLGKKGLPWRDRIAAAWPVLKGGLLSLPLAFGFGLASSALHASTASPLGHAAAGVLFAFACSAGTIGTSIAAFRKSWRNIQELESDRDLGQLVNPLSFWERAKLAFHESIMSVPFRIGHTVLGVPVQIGLGVAAGLFGFFHHSGFVMVEGMAETLLGAAVAFAYPSVSRWWHYRRLRHS